MAFFKENGKELLNIIQTIDYTVATSYMSDLKPVVAAGLGLYLLWLMIPLFLGNGQNTAEDIMKKIIVWMIIFTVAFTPTWIKQIQSMMNETYTWAGGGEEFFTNLDKWYKELSKAGSTIYNLDKDFVPLRGFIAQGMITIGVFFVIILPFFVIIGSSIVMQLILLLAPFMILALISSTVKKMFFNWLEQFITLLLVVLIISLLQSSLVSNITTFTQMATSTITTGGKSLDLIATSLYILILCIIYGGMLLSSVPIARAISGTWHEMKIGKTGL